MAVIEQQVSIEAPIEKVYEYIAHPERNKEWIPDVLESVKLTEGPNGPGSRFRFVTRAPLGLRVTAEAAIVTMDPPHLLEFCSTRGFDHCGRWELEARDGVTLVRFRIRYRLSRMEAVVMRAAGLNQFVSQHVEESIEGLRRALANGKATS
ncbi:MAG: hypothetical protein GX774_07760 [Armatimonadetes bacterium]|jgi:uncharacterized membrane protein|nr:hypothetical protein [Armatimonadota bacterium]